MEDYDVIKEIGHGGHGTVYSVTHKRSGKMFVMKKTYLAHMNVKERMAAQQEVLLLKSLKHPYIVNYEDSFLDNDNNLCIVMENCNGGDLGTKLSKVNGKYLPEEQIITWFVQLALAVCFMHRKKILHRDLKTNNIFLSEDGSLKLGDFGVARILDQTMDMAQTAIGSPSYLSPELCEAKPYNQKSDIWSLGCVLYEMATLKKAFDGPNLASVVIKIVKGRYPPIPHHFSTILSNLIDNMLQKSPHARPSIEEIISLPFIQKKIVDLINENSSGSGNWSQYLALNPPHSSNPPSQGDGSNLLKKRQDDEWIKKQNSKLDEMFNELHPSLRLTKKETLLAERQDKVVEKQKDRRSFYMARLEKKTQQQGEVNDAPVRNSRQAEIQVTELQPPKQIQSVDIPPKAPKVKAKPSSRRVSAKFDEKKLLQQLNGKNPKAAPKMSKEEMRKEMENKKRRESFLKLSKEKRELRQKEKEELDKKIKEHKNKLKHVQPSVDWKKMKLMCSRNENSSSPDDLNSNDPDDPNPDTSSPDTSIIITEVV